MKINFSQFIPSESRKRLNDLPMLLKMDHPILLDGGQGVLFESLSSIQNLTVMDGSGPESWSTAILNIMNEQ